MATSTPSPEPAAMSPRTRRPRRPYAVLIATAMAGLLLLTVATTGAYAATTYTSAGGPGLGLAAAYDKPGVPVEMVPGLKLTLIETAQTITCTGFSMTGSVVSPGVSRPYGAAAATLGTLSAPGCTNPIMGPTTFASLATSALTVTGDATGGQWPARVTNVKWKVTWVNCSFYVAGVIEGSLDVVTQVFSPVGNPSTPGGSPTPTGLTISAVPAPPTGSMCVNLDLQAGDSIGITGTFENTPPAGSTALAVTNP